MGIIIYPQDIAHSYIRKLNWRTHSCMKSAERCITKFISEGDAARTDIRAVHKIAVPFVTGMSFVGPRGSFCEPLLRFISN